VAEVMLSEKQTPVPIKTVPGTLVELIAKQALLKELLTEPKRNSHLERPETPGCEGDISFQEALKLQEGLVIKHDVVNLIGTHTFLGEAIVNSMRRKTSVVLLPAEALLLCCGNNLTIAD
jgi:hypothetical protein